MSALLTLLLVGFSPFIAIIDKSDPSDGPDDEVADADAPESVTPETEPSIPDPAAMGVALTGSEENEMQIGTVLNDTLSGLGGADTQTGNAGDDLIDGGDGNDVQSGNAGDDTLDGGPGDDVMDGGLGQDILFGGAGADAVDGASGNDTLSGGDAAGPMDGASDTLDGGPGQDVLILSDTDQGIGGLAADRFTLGVAETGAITIIDFDTDEDVLAIEQDPDDPVAVDSQTVTPDGLLITFDSGATVLLEGVSAPIDVATIDFVDVEDDTPDVVTFEGNDGDEILGAPAPGQSLNADLAGGDDAATGGDGNDTIEGGTGADTLTGGAGNDILFATSADTTEASDTDVDSLEGGLGDDTLVLGTADIADGGAGADTFVLRQDVSDTVTIGDFDAALDALVVEADDPGTVSVTGQEVVAAGLLITLSTGGVIELRGQTVALDPDDIRIESPGTSSAA